MHVCFRYVRFSFSVLSQEIGWEERLRNDLFYVEWDVKPLLDLILLLLTLSLVIDADSVWL